jgi:ubiquinone/menaquinone biosynthesis C-methylase UbiE
MTTEEHSDRFSSIRGYVEEQRTIPVETREADVETQLRRLGKLGPVGEGRSFLELGMGAGWMTVLLAERGLRCAGIEHNPELADLARERAREHGVSIDVMVGSIETYPLEPASYDIVVANSVLEHVPDYRAAIANAYRALRPGGVFYFNSSNKFALRSGEYPPMRLYGWLPYRARRRIRISRQGPGVVESGGMDANQFTYPGLRRTLKRTGFSKVLDIYELLDVEDLNHPTPLRRTVMRAYKRFPPLKWLITTFADGTHFYCVK